MKRGIFRRLGVWIAVIAGLSAMLPTSVVLAEEGILAVLFENGDLPPPSSNGTIFFPLFCEGETQCGSVLYNDLHFNRLDATGIDFIATVKVCKSSAESAASCVTARNAHYLADSLPIENPDGTLFSEHMVEHDPIQCSDVTGEFSAPGCAGKLKLDYRCLNLADVAAGHFIKAFASSYVISEIF